MPSSVIAFSPGHISGYFCRVAKERIDQTGSIGAGIVLGLGVVATVAEADEIDVIISAGGVQVSGSPPVMAALKKLNVTASVKTASNLPLGSGFGLSAASLLAVLVAADELFSLSMGIETIAAIAHEIEVIYGNGLGDVAAECEGGLACRTAPGIAGVTSRIHGIRDPITIVTTGPLSTREVLTTAETMDRVQASYPGRCPKDLDDFFRLSRAFAESSGLITREVRSILSACDDAGIAASMTMLGAGVFSADEGAEAVLSRFGTVYSTTIADAGPKILDVVP